jgi:ATP-binding cassette subfamily C protein
LFPPQSGKIFIGNAELKNATLFAWRAQLSYVAQDPFLFHDTIRHNLSWAKPDADEAELWASLSIAGAEPLVNRLIAGLDSIVGERGALLSGGERQRIGLARAVLRRPRLLVLDEATSAIDIAGEREILDRLLGLHPRPTMVMVAHRLESLSLCDRVVYFDAGRLMSVTVR